MSKVPSGTKAPPPAWPQSRRDQSSGQAIPSCHFSTALLLRNTLCKCLVLQYVTFASKAPKLPAASPLASLSPQRGEGLRVRGGHIQSRLPSVSSRISPIRGPGGKLLKNTLCKCLLLQHVTFVANAPKMPVASPLASLSPQRGEGLRVRGGHIQSRLPFLPVSAPSGVPA